MLRFTNPPARTLHLQKHPRCPIAPSQELIRFAVAHLFLLGCIEVQLAVHPPGRVPHVHESGSDVPDLEVASVYPNVFVADEEDNASGQVARAVDGSPVTASLHDGVNLGTSGHVYLILYGSGRGEMTAATTTIRGVAATVTDAVAQGQYAGIDQYNLNISRSLVGRGRVPVILTPDGNTSNPNCIIMQQVGIS